MTRAPLLAAAVALGCAPPSDTDEERALRELVPAVDVDPDPSVVEIELVAAPASFSYVDGTNTDVWAYRDRNGGDARVPGPLIEAELGQTLVVHLKNDLPDPTTIHWHGVRLPEAMDGNPMQHGPVQPGASFTYRFELIDAGTFWYHPHVDPDVQVERGLHGALVVRDPADPPVDRERVLMLDDIELDEDGALVIDASPEDLEMGRHGNTLLVNGGLPGTLDVQAGTLERWRIVDVANGRLFALALGDETLDVIAGDGGLLPAPIAADELALVPGERHELLLAIGSDDDGLALRTAPDHADAPGSDDLTLAVLAVAGDAVRPAKPAYARTIDPLPLAATTVARRFELRADLDPPEFPTFFINDQRWPLDTPVHVELGDVEIWEVVNLGDHAHPFHIHGLFALVLDDTGAPDLAQGWKDTVQVPARGRTRLAMRYDAPGMWMYHCTIPEHAERGMMGDLHVMADDGG
ncbi:MAG TPA: multicopper oxidase family protein [Nannocystaceae bacterium]|nr:multicopper oxidase family protein [Nannocystaceae bacterium]